MIDGISSTNFKMSFINSINSVPKEPKKKSNFKKYFLSSGIIGLGATAGGIVENKKYNNFIKQIEKIHDTAFKKLESFVNKDEGFGIDKGFTGRESIKPYSRMCDQIKSILEGRDAERPNCLLFVGDDEKKVKKVIDWFVSKTKTNYAESSPYKEDIADVLDILKNNFKKTGKYNTLYIENFDRCINPNISPRELIENAKRITDEKLNKTFHTVLLFQTKDYTQLSEEVVSQSYRVNTIYNVDKMKHFDEFKKLFDDVKKYEDVLENQKKNPALKGVGIGALIGISALIVINTIKHLKNRKGAK